MKTKGFVVPPGGGQVLNLAPGRFSALKLLGGATDQSIMLFGETAPPGAETTFTATATRSPMCWRAKWRCRSATR